MFYGNLLFYLASLIILEQPIFNPSLWISKLTAPVDPDPTKIRESSLLAPQIFLIWVLESSLICEIYMPVNEASVWVFA